MPTSRQTKNSVTNGREYKVSPEGKLRLGKLLKDFINLNKLINSGTLSVRRQIRFKRLYHETVVSIYKEFGISFEVVEDSVKELQEIERIEKNRLLA